jgi:hypothetical protein
MIKKQFIKIAVEKHGYSKIGSLKEHNLLLVKDDRTITINNTTFQIEEKHKKQCWGYYFDTRLASNEITGCRLFSRGRTPKKVIIKRTTYHI